MEKINELFDVQITSVIDAYPSIYTKDDVVSLLCNLRTQTLTEVSDNIKVPFIKEMEFQDFSDKVTTELRRQIERGDLELATCDNVEFSMDHHNTIVVDCVEIDTDTLSDELHNILLDSFQSCFGKLLDPNVDSNE